MAEAMIKQGMVMQLITRLFSLQFETKKLVAQILCNLIRRSKAMRARFAAAARRARSMRIRVCSFVATHTCSASICFCFRIRRAMRARMCSC